MEGLTAEFVQPPCTIAKFYVNAQFWDFFEIFSFSSRSAIRETIRKFNGEKTLHNVIFIAHLVIECFTVNV